MTSIEIQPEVQFQLFETYPEPIECIRVRGIWIPVTGSTHDGWWDLIYKASSHDYLLRDWIDSNTLDTMNQVYQVYASGTGDASAMIDVRSDGKIVAVYAQTFDETTGNAKAELSFGSTSAFSTNDATQVIASVEAIQARLGNLAMQDLDISVAAGERLYLHVDGAATSESKFLVVIDEKASRSSSVRRR